MLEKLDDFIDKINDYWLKKTTQWKEKVTNVPTVSSKQGGIGLDLWVVIERNPALDRFWVGLTWEGKAVS